MTCLADARVLFVAAAGPSRGFGHLVRCLSLARALGVRPLLAVRGGRQATDAALSLGADVIAAATPRMLGKLRPDVVIVDDPIERRARIWIEAARRAGSLVVTVHDLGIGCTDSDLVIDGSVTKNARPRRGARALTGGRYAVLDPRVAAYAASRRDVAAGKRVLIALGGGSHAHTAATIADRIVSADPQAHVRIAGGFIATPRPASPRVEWVGAQRGLASELSQASVAVVGGGVSLYEAAAIGVPAVGVPVVRGQVPTVRAFARKKAALCIPFPAAPSLAARRAVRLLNDAALQQSLTRRSRRLVDGRGAMRAAAAVAALAQKEPS